MKAWELKNQLTQKSILGMLWPRLTITKLLEVKRVLDLVHLKLRKAKEVNTAEESHPLDILSKE